MANKTIIIDGYIGALGFSKQYVRNELQGAEKKPVSVKISSMGGSVGHAFSIFDQFREHGNVTAELSAFVASSATLISLGAKTVQMNENSFYLIHKPMYWVDSWGTMNEDDIDSLVAQLEKQKQQLAKITIQMARMYVAKTGKSLEEIIRLKRQIIPFVSKSGVLFTLANAFDNIENLGFSYILREYEKQSLLTFLIEILNWIIDKVEDCYYYIDPEIHVYYDAFNNDFIRGVAEDSNWDVKTLEAPDCRCDLDCDPSKPLELSPDWCSKINLFSVGQERNFNFVSKIVEPVDCFLNEFFNKPQETNKVMIHDLVDQFCDYYFHHPVKTVHYYRDKYGDHRQPNVKNAQSFNEQAIKRFREKGWEVVTRAHKGQEPPQHDKYLLWINILKGKDEVFPKVIFNGKNCKYTLISMNNTKVIEREGKFGKAKSSERNKRVLPEEATHFSDAADKRIWTKYGNNLFKSRTSFINPRL